MSYETNKEKNGMGTKMFITIYIPNSFMENVSPIIFFINKINTKVFIVLACVTYNIKCTKVTFLTQYQAFPAVVAFQQGLPIFHFSF